jgi:guanosine-3',5'-bis(diphosphate) 3'-pyrophosphohydrolase
MSNVDHALAFATAAHSGQTRDGDPHLPYVTHPIEVLLVLRRLGQVESPEILMAAVLHDTLEETSATENEIAQIFGTRVASLVRELTRKEPTSSELDGLDSDARYALRTERLLTGVAAMSPDAKLIKLADRYVNLQEGKSHRKPKNWDRYCRQTEALLARIPREICPALWDAVAKSCRV